MKSALLSRGQLAVCIGLFSALAGSLVVAGCRPVHYIYPRNVQAFVLPPKCPPGVAPRNPTELGACLRGIEFDTTESMGDEQRLMVRELSRTGPRCHGDSTYSCRYGPLAKIEPVKGAETYSDSALAEGRIIARMYLRRGETEPYPKMGLVPGDTTYWWVRTSPARSVFVHRDSTRMELVATVRGLERTKHPRGTFQQAFASWIWDEKDEKANGGCGSGCCKPS